MRCFWILCFSVLSLVACNGNDKEQQGQHILYYPKANLYYDIEQKQYYVYESGHQAWKRVKEVDYSEAQLGKRVMIDQVSIPVYQDNEQHKLIYGASLYNTTRDDIRRKFVEDSLKSLPRQAPEKDSTIAVKKKRSGIRRFFDRIFHGKNKH
jgi:hypothetical protein